MWPRPIALVLGCTLALALAIGCDSEAEPQQGLLAPPQTGDGWRTASLEDVGMESQPLLDLLALIERTDNHMIHSILIVRDQRLVFEEYWRGTDLGEGLNPVERSFDSETLHYAASVSKSITSALVGIALDQGLIDGVNEPVFSFFPEHVDLRNETNSQITLEHLLAFSSGYEWNEFDYGFDDPRDSHFQMFATPEPIHHLLSRPVVFTPGSDFLYNSGDTNLVGEIVRRETSSATLPEFAREYLLQPLGIGSYTWWMFPLADHVAFASGGVSLRPRDMAKLGALYLNGGTWNGARIVSASWVEASTRVSTPIDGVTVHGYGYNWWLGRSQLRDSRVDYFRAMGWGGQNVYVYPELNLVLVFTAGGYYEQRPLDLNDIIEQYIFRAIVD